MVNYLLKLFFSNSYLNYKEAMFLLVEYISMYIQFVQYFAGPGRLFTLMKILQTECDRQSRKIIEKFKHKRDFDSVVRGTDGLIREVKHTNVYVNKYVCSGICVYYVIMTSSVLNAAKIFKLFITCKL